MIAGLLIGGGIGIMAVGCVGYIGLHAQQARRWGHIRGYREGWFDGNAGRQYGEGPDGQRSAPSGRGDAV